VPEFPDIHAVLCREKLTPKLTPSRFTIRREFAATSIARKISDGVGATEREGGRDNYAFNQIAFVVSIA
jgi:hypothetical protein